MKIENDIKAALLEDLQNEFLEVFKINGFKLGFTKLLILENRTKIINKLCKTTEERYIINSNYDKVLKQAGKIAQNDELAKNAINELNKVLENKEQEDKEKEERKNKYIQEREKRKKKEKRKKIEKTLTIILLLPFIIFWIIFKLCLGLSEGQQNGKRHRF